MGAEAGPEEMEAAQPVGAEAGAEEMEVDSWLESEAQVAQPEAQPLGAEEGQVAQPEAVGAQPAEADDMEVERSAETVAQATVAQATVAQAEAAPVAQATVAQATVEAAAQAAQPEANPWVDVVQEFVKLLKINEKWWENLRKTGFSKIRKDFGGELYELAKFIRDSSAVASPFSGWPKELLTEVSDTPQAYAGKEARNALAKMVHEVFREHSAQIKNAVKAVLRRQSPA